jgi:hypothetical protein
MAAAPSYLALGLLAGATAGGAWAAAVGCPNFGIRAAAELGGALERFLLLDEPGDRWPEAVALLANAVDIVLLRPRDGRPASNYASSRARRGPPSGSAAPCWWSLATGPKHTCACTPISLAGLDWETGPDT